ncbi:uncharacterized protein VTP21DRAFT_1878 [Calcarisporiella thermophila]|uniref:uncharacterized protein n=1 Tax=Calcarisporiella thermophila TaxID=911321 RepID=UPI003743D3EF
MLNAWILVIVTLCCVVASEQSGQPQKFSLLHKLPTSTQFVLRGEIEYHPSLATARYIPSSDFSSSSLSANEDELYSVKMVRDESEDGDIMSVPVKALKGADFRDEIVLFADHDGVVRHFEYGTRANKENEDEIGTLVKVEPASLGARPKLLQAVPLNRDGTVEKKEEPSLLKKYWYFIPLVIILLTGGGGGQQQEQGQQGGGGGSR